MARKTKDLAEAYPAACAEAKCKAVAPFVGALARAVDAGAELTFVRLSRNSKELFTAASTAGPGRHRQRPDRNRDRRGGGPELQSHRRRGRRGHRGDAREVPRGEELDLRGNDTARGRGAHRARARGDRRVRRVRGSETNDDAASASSSSFV